MEAGQIAIRKDQDLARVYQRVLVRRGHAKAKVAVGRRLLVRAFIMLRETSITPFHDVAPQLGLPVNRVALMLCALEWAPGLPRAADKCNDLIGLSARKDD